MQSIIITSSNKSVCEIRLDIPQSSLNGSIAKWVYLGLNSFFTYTSEKNLLQILANVLKMKSKNTTYTSVFTSFCRYTVTEQGL